jgi:tetratricopeptide (TPR) repeat protein
MTITAAGIGRDGTGRLTLFGRASELRAIEEIHRAVLAGQPRVVTIVGAGGVGKTRLANEALAKLRVDGGAAPTVLRSIARANGSAFDVIARLLRTRLDIPYGLDDEVAKERLRAAVEAALGDRKVNDVCYFLGGLLDLKFPSSPLIASIEDDPMQLRSLLRAVLKRLIEAEAANAPGSLIVLLEDLHHAHDDAIDLIEHLASHAQGKVLLLATARPELLARRGEWASMGGTRHQVLELGPLGELDAERMVAQLLAPVAAGGGEIPGELIDAAVGMSGGNPALIERLIRILHDAGVLSVTEVPTEDPFVHEERWKVDLERLGEVQLPLNVQDAVAARLAALDPFERDVLERAAVMGAVFWAGGVLALGRIAALPPEHWQGEEADKARLAAVLDELVERDHLLAMPDSSFPGELEYVFKHNLEREALERLIPAASARRYHQAIADWMEFRPGVRAHEEHVAALALHRERAGATTQAALTWIDAGNIARSRYANAKAAECYARGLSLLGDRDARVRLGALHDYGDVLFLLGRYDEALANFVAMRDLAWQLDLPGKGGAAHNRIGRLYRDSGRLDLGQTHLEVARDLFTRASDERGIASSLDDIGKLAWMRGDYQGALRDLRAALVARKRLGDRRSIALSLNNLGLVLQDSGQFKEALEAFEQALAIRRDIGDLIGVVNSLNNLGTVAQDQRDDRRALELFTEALGIAREVSDRQKCALVLTNIGETHYRLGHLEPALATLKEAEALAEEIGDRMILAEAMRGLGKAYLLHGDMPKAREHTARAVELFAEVRSQVQIGIALRTLGEVTAAGGWGDDHVAAAKEHFQRSMEIFATIGNEVELARSQRAYGRFLENLIEHRFDEQLRQQAAELLKRADDVFTKLRISAIGIDPGAFFS